MIRLFDDANYDFLAARKVAYGLSLAVALVGFIALGFRGLNEGIEFTGGTFIQIHAVDSTISVGGIRTALVSRGINAEITTFGTPRDFSIRTQVSAEAEDADDAAQQAARDVEAALTEGFGAGSYTVDRVEAVGPKVGGELRTKALLAIVLSFGATLVYLTFRFEWRFAVAAIVATAHDIMLTMAFLGLMHLEVTLVVVAAVLTIVGYSLNDTIIVFDRVRENLRKYKRANIYEILNRSVNETLPRTVLTGGTTLAATLSLLIFAGPVIRGFAWVMTFGIIVGTFSSIYIASPVLLAIERRWPGEDIRGTKALAASPATAATPAGQTT
jgi:preprotein translocase subunit SecF